MNDFYEEIVKQKKLGQSCVSVTVVDKSGDGPCSIGAKMIVLENGNILGTVGGGSVEKIAIEYAKAIFKNKKSEMLVYDLGENSKSSNIKLTGMVCGGTTTLFYEYIDSGVNVYLFGAGHIGKALVYHLKELNYNIHMIDSRIGIFDDIDGEFEKINCEYKNFDEKITIKPDSMILITTHSHSFDYHVLANILHKDYSPKFIGMISSKKKIAKFKEDLLKDHIEFKNKPLYAPVGIDIGGVSPHEIAISIIAQMQAISHNKESIKNMDQ